MLLFYCFSTGFYRKSSLLEKSKVDPIFFYCVLGVISYTLVRHSFSCHWILWYFNLQLLNRRPVIFKRSFYYRFTHKVYINIKLQISTEAISGTFKRTHTQRHTHTHGFSPASARFLISRISDTFGVLENTGFLQRSAVWQCLI